MDGGRTVFEAEFVDALSDGIGKFAIKNAGAVIAILINGILAEAGVEAADDVVEIFVNQDHRGAEDDEIEIEDRHGVVEVRFLEHHHHQAFAFS